MPIWKCNGKEKVNNNQKKRIYFKILNLLLVIILVFSVASVGGCSMESKQGAKGAKSAGKRQSEDARFEEYTAELFCKEVSANTVSLHYTLKAPEKYGIEATDATFGQFEREPEAVKAAAENMRQALLGFNYDDLNVQNKITYDILNYRLKLMKKSADYTMYEEPLGLVSGAQTQLPVVLSEYRFYDKEDVEVYLALVRQTEEYFEEIMIFEKKKAEMGLFMPDQAVETVIGQCRAFLEMGNGNYLYSTFADRVMELNTLTEKEKSDYIQENALAISDYVFPAYERMTEELEQLKGSGKNEKGLVYFPKGKEYYELLARQSTGSRRSVEELKDLTRRQINEDLTAMEQVLGLTTKEAKEAAAVITDKKAEQILEQLKEGSKTAFPEPPQTKLEVKYVPEAMEEHLSPAFYMIPAIDNSQQNVIYINRARMGNDMTLFTTLAHEGYPGHLYQTTSFASCQPEDIRYLISCGGYVEGWATYVESCLPSYADNFIKDSDAKNLSSLYWLNRSINLCIYSLLDIGIHEHGWNQSQTARFLRVFGIQKTDVIQEIYQYIVETPANYLKYYWGYLNFLDLKEMQKEELGEAFDLRLFHQKVLEIGPVPFPVLYKYMTQ